MPVTDMPRFGRRTSGDDPLSVFDAITRRNSIRGILLFIVLVAFLPTLGLSAWQGMARLTRDADSDQRRLTGAAVTIGRSEANILGGSRGILAVLAAVPAVRTRDQAGCGPILAEAVKQFPEFSHLSVAGPDGRLACAGDPRAIGKTFDDPRLWNRLATGGFLVTSSAHDPVSQRPALRAILPLRTAAGRFDGAIMATIDLVWLRRALTTQDDRENVAVALVDGAGHPIAHSRPLPWDRVVIPAASKGDNRIPVIGARDRDGARWSYAVAPLRIAGNDGESFHIVYAAARPAPFGSDWWFAAGYFVLPLLALALAASAIWIGANRAILRWVLHLGELARQIGAHDDANPPYRSHFANAPSEVRDLAAELLRVGNTITDREQRLRGAIADQTEVARELHHRVRNNLQVMASFLSLQAEGVPPGSARHALEAAKLRVATMAMVNGLLYADAEVTTVSLAALLEPVADLLARHSGIRGEVSVDPLLAPRAVDIDRAIPLSLWIVEAAVCLFERIDNACKPPLFTVGITSEDDVMCIVVTVRGPLPAPPRHSLHRRLVTAIAHQLGGRSRIDAIGSSGAKVVLCLPQGELTAAPGHAPVGVSTGIAA